MGIGGIKLGNPVKNIKNHATNASSSLGLKDRFDNLGAGQWAGLGGKANGGSAEFMDSVAADGRIDENEINAFLADDEKGASRLNALIYRMEHEKWMDKFLPRAEALRDKVLSGETVTNAVNQAKESNALAFENSRKNLAMDNERLGLDFSTSQQNIRNNKMGLAESAQKVSSVNSARVAAKDRENAILAGGLGSGLKTDNAGD